MHGGARIESGGQRFAEGGGEGEFEAGGHIDEIDDLFGFIILMPQAQAQRLGVAERVHFLGWRQDTAALLAAADMFVCSSRHEPLGNVVIEAWAAGIPVIAADADGPRELIKNNETGLLVPVENADALANAMQVLATDEALRARLVAAGRAAYETEFSEPRVIALYKEFFEKVKR